MAEPPLQPTAAPCGRIGRIDLPPAPQDMIAPPIHSNGDGVITRFKLTPALALLACAASLPASEVRDRWRGPIEIRSQFPLDIPTLDLTPRSAKLLDPGEFALDLLVTDLNTFQNTRGHEDREALYPTGVYPPGYSYNVDTEVLRTSLCFEAGVTRRVQIGLEIPYLSQSEGWMDHAINEFHQSLGLPENDRNNFPDDVFDVDVIAGSRRLHLTDDTSSIGDVVLRTKVLLWEGDLGALSFAGDIKAPTGEEKDLAGSGQWDFGGSLLVSIGSRHNVFHGGLGYQWLGQPDLYPVEIDNRFTVYGGYEYSAAHWSFLTQVVGATSILPAGTGDQPSESRVDMSIGFEWSADAFRVGAGLLEDISTHENTGDVGLYLNLGWTLGH